jgi:hypothetical protein
MALSRWRPVDFGGGRQRGGSGQCLERLRHAGSSIWGNREGGSSPDGHTMVMVVERCRTVGEGSGRWSMAAPERSGSGVALGRCSRRPWLDRKTVGVAAPQWCFGAMLGSQRLAVGAWP